ncbi:DUF6786 family protein [Persicitalea jodogahamensis]|uniref:Lipoprotein n=1 Tax=Persicitalea jodogahamensis TaxID=402147 RepID=A0A8J3DBC2_9BACT|nr:DUF6786 family protein [Persicitalea jodogahamensis]GHB78648.1 hypothetical protein GCM10007390_36300 [Persicitalea jodogahamensis]
MKKIILVLINLLVLMACSTDDKATETSVEEHPQGTFGYDLGFLQKQDSNLVVLANLDRTAQIIVSAKYQGKVFTSTADGLSGRSFGWVNYKAFSAEKDEHMNGYGGENRLWLGPEGAQFSLFFKPGASMEFENWHTPAAFDSEAWNIVSKNRNEVVMEKAMNLINYAGTNLNLKVERAVRLMNKDQINELLGADLQQSNSVAYSTENTLINTGPEAWNEQTGAPCLWLLDMFAPSSQTTIVIPYEKDAKGKVATTDYFGQIPPDRVTYKEGTLYFKADGKSRGKLGIPPQRAREIAGSYDAANKVLTLTVFNVDREGTYLNQEWKLVDEPLIGDAVNAYNDGPLDDGSQMGPFYELESVSPAAFLRPGEKLTHHHTVIHLTGSTSELDRIARRTLGVSLEEIQNAFGE